MQQSSVKNNKTVGIISITRRGVGYVTAENIEEDIEIEPEQLGTALHGNMVEVTLLPRKRGKRVQGTVTKVMTRQKTRFVGILERESGHLLLKADDRRMYRDILIPEQKIPTKQIEKDTKALVRLTTWHDQKKNPEGEIIHIIGKTGLHETEMQAIVLEHGFEAAFPREIEKEAEAIRKGKSISKQDIAQRRDFRDVTTFTIDPDDAKDFDDALSIRELGNGNIEVGIHIADVSHYVQPGSAIDTEAQGRGTSIYLVDRTIPMLPEVLSNDVCSLNPGEDKLTYAAVFELDHNAHLKNSWFGETVIHSDKRFTYEEAQNVLNLKKGEYFHELQTLDRLAKIMRKKRAAAGAISFEQDEVKFRLDESGKPLEVFKKKRLDTHMLVEDFMLFANRNVAEHVHQFCKKQGLREAMFVYRIHDLPDADRLEELGIFLRAVGYDFEVTEGKDLGQDINRLFKQIEGKPEESLIKTATIRSMAKAVYSTKNIGHFGLAFQYYTHFTSPIRRYPDVMVHRIMKSLFGGHRLTQEQFHQYERLTIKSSQREIEAVGAERDSVKYKQVEYMLDKVGQTFDGVVVGVTEWGLYVEEAKTRADGLLRIKNLADDYYLYEKKRYRLVGEKRKRAYSLGDKMKVKLVDANLEDRTLEWKMA